MKFSHVVRMWTACTAVVASIALATTVSAQEEIIWEAYNDYRSGEFTHENVTDWDLRVTDDGGQLRDFATGDDLEAEVLVLAEGTPDDFGADAPPDEGSPADLFFRDKVDMTNEGLPGLRAGNGVLLSLVFQNLDPTKRYKFRGTVVRGGSYDERWSVFTITGTDAHVAGHVDGSDNLNIITKDTFPDADLGPNQVAMNTGHNLEGSLVGWDNIEPGDDGEFTIDAEQWQGETPYGDAGAGPYGYGFYAIYLAEIESTGSLRITENPPVEQIISAGATATMTVEASSPDPITYQWQRCEPGDDEFNDVAGATEATYVTPALTVDDNGAKYRCKLTSGDNEAISGVTELEVDGVLPFVDGIDGSINFNAVFITFSEAMKLDLLEVKENYEISGGVTVESAEVIPAVFGQGIRVKLTTSPQPRATTFTLTVKELEDLAGNKVDGNVSVEFKSLSLANGAVGLEIWRNIFGGGIPEFLDDPRYPDEPSIDFSTTGIDSLLVFLDGPNNTYGGRFRAWLIPQETAEYEFFLAAADNGEFSISENEQFGPLENPSRIPELSASGGVFDFASDPIMLEAGKKYAVQVLWKEGNGGDRAQLAWQKAGEEIPLDDLEPIPSEFFCYFGPQAPDEDNDGMSDVYEGLNGLSVGTNDADEDLDGDGLTNKQEHDIGSAANSDDTDGDGLKDGVETNTGVRVSETDTGTNPLSSDTDADGLSDGVETLTGVLVSETDTGTDPLNPDSDGDGARDGLEVTAGFDPNSAASIPSVIRGGGTFETTHVWTDGDPEFIDIFEAEEILLDDDGGGERITTNTDFIHFHDNADPPIFFDDSRPFPLWDDDNGGEGGFGDRDNFMIRSVGQINVTVGGLISFICNSDDGFILRIDGDDVGEAGDRGRADTLMEVNLEAGVHDLELIYYELGGGAGLSLYVYRGVGVAPELSEDEWELVRAAGGGPTFEISDVKVEGGMVTFSWPSSVGESFIIEQGTDLIDWEEVTDGHPSEGTTTSFTIDLVDPAPDELYIRVKRE